MGTRLRVHAPEALRARHWTTRAATAVLRDDRPLASSQLYGARRMIRMRDDDVLVRSRSFSSPLARFQQMHEWILLCPQMVHVPTLIVEELREFPRCVEYIRQETAEGRMVPEVHCMFHEIGRASCREEWRSRWS